jgi:hypothetical protein
METRRNNMRLKSIIKKATLQISHPTAIEKAQMANIVEIEKFAEDKIANAEVGEKILAALSNPAVSAGIGGALAGGGTYLSSQRGEDESEEEFKKRQIKDSLVNSLAGAAVGGAAPIAINAVKDVAVPSEEGIVKKLFGKAMGNTLWAGGGAATGFGVDAWRHSTDAAKKTEALISALKSQIGNTGIDVKSLQNLAGNVPPSGQSGPLDDLLKHIKNMVPAKPEAYLNTNLMNQQARMTRHGDVGKSLLSVLNRKDFMPALLKGKLRNPALAAGAALTLPFILKKLDQAANQ